MILNKASLQSKTPGWHLRYPMMLHFGNKMLNKASWDIREVRVISEISHDVSMLELMMAEFGQKSHMIKKYPTCLDFKRDLK